LQYPAKLTISMENLKIFLELPDVMNVSNSKNRSKMIY
jgi:glutaredoxin-related protein